MKTIVRLLSKVFKTQKQTELTDAQLDAWIVSIRQKPQRVGKPITVYVGKQKYTDNGLEESDCLVLA